MYSIHKKQNSNELFKLIQNEFQLENVYDEILNQTLSKLQPWILTIFVIFGLYFILIIAILVLILRNDIKK